MMVSTDKNKGVIGGSEDNGGAPNTLMTDTDMTRDTQGNEEKGGANMDYTDVDASSETRGALMEKDSDRTDEADEDRELTKKSSPSYESGGEYGCAKVHRDDKEETPIDDVSTSLKGSFEETPVVNPLQGIIDMMPAPYPALRRAPRANRGPGAYAEGGAAPFRGSAARQHEVHSTTQDTAPETPHPAVVQDVMAEATPVEENHERDLEDARPFDPEEREQRKRKQKKHCLTGLLTLLALAVVASTISMGMLIENKKKTTKDVPNGPTTTAPSLAPSLLPSVSPSELLGLFTQELPIYTQESLLDPFSAQSQALHWLREHQNLTSLEEWRLVQLFAIATVFYSLNGPEWPREIRDSWLDDTKSECNWFSNGYGHYQNDGTWAGVPNSPWFPCNEEGVYENFMIASVPLSGGELPAEIMLLSSLKTVAVLFTNIGKPLADFLPTEIYQMPSIKTLMFDKGGLTGAIPTELGIMNLQKLSMMENQLNGTIPSEVGMIKSLQNLDLGGNFLSGSIPTELFKLTQLELLFVGPNLLTGTMATELGLLSNLEVMGVIGTTLSGTIPTEVGLLSETITFLELQSSSLTGSLPTTLGLLTKLVRVGLHDNQFSGFPPTELGLLTNLVTLKADGNVLSGSLPTELGRLLKLDLLDLGSNALTGLMPSELGLLTNLSFMDLSHSSIIGSIPVEIATLASSYNLRYFNISGSQVTGTVPELLCPRENTTECGGMFVALAFHMSISIFDCSETDFDCSECLCGCNCPCKNVTDAVANREESSLSP